MKGNYENKAAVSVAQFEKSKSEQKENELKTLENITAASQEEAYTEPKETELEEALPQTVISPVNRPRISLVSAKKDTKSNRKGFLLTDAALNNLRKISKESGRSENDMVNYLFEHIYEIIS